MNIIRWIKPLMLFGLVAYVLWRVYAAGYDSADTSWSFKWVQRDLADSTITLHRDIAERAKEQRRQRAADNEQKRAAGKLAKVQAEADAADFAADGLRKQLASVQRQLAGSETGRLSAIAAAGAAKVEVARLLAQLLGESDRLAGEFAKEADERYIAGQTCERIYDKVTNQPGQR